jgi:hypothetical protein
MLVKSVVKRLGGGRMHGGGEDHCARAHDVGDELDGLTPVVVALMHGADGVLLYEPTRIKGSRLRFGAVW